MNRMVRVICIVLGVLLIGFALSANWAAIVPLGAIVTIPVAALLLFYGFRKS